MVKWLYGDRMVKTTFEIKDEVYRKLVETSLKKYGNTKNLSKVANEMMEERLREPKIHERARHFTPEEKEKRRRIVEESFGIWKDMKISGAEYVRRIRKGWEKRAKRLGI